MASFRSELKVYNLSENFIYSIMEKLQMIYDTSNQSEYSLEHMNNCRDMTIRLDKIRKENLIDMTSYFKSYDDFTNN